MSRDGQGEQEPVLTPKKARNAIRVAKVVGPAAVPVLAPAVVRATGAIREAYDRYQARRIGVSVEQLPEYTGHGGALLARIAGVSDNLHALRQSSEATEDDRDFAEQCQSSLEQLTISVRTAERMPTVRRKAAHRAVANELQRMEDGLLHRLGL